VSSYEWQRSLQMKPDQDWAALGWYERTSTPRPDLAALIGYCDVYQPCSCSGNHYFVRFEPWPARLEGLRRELLPTTSTPLHQEVKSLDNESAANLMHTFVTSRVDYCNAIYAISPKMITNRQQNGDERDRCSVTLVNDRELKAILRDELHWLDVPKRIQAWCDGVAYRCLHARRLGTSLITSSQPLMLLLAVFVYDPLTWIVSLFLAADLACTAAGPFITMARQSGTRCQI